VFYDGENIIAPKIVPNPIKVIETFDDESYLGLYNNAIKVYFKRMLNGEYHITIGEKKINPHCFVSKKLDTVFCLVSRNANTSVILSGLYAVGNKEFENYPNDKFLWGDAEVREVMRKNGQLQFINDVNPKFYNKFVMVIDGPLKRYIRALNRLLISPHLPKDKIPTISKEYVDTYINNMLEFSDYCENDKNFTWEQHLGLQSSYYDVCTKKGKDVELVQLSDLPQWWEHTYNSKWLRNNVSTPSERIITFDNMTDEQKEKTMKFLENDIKWYENNSKGKKQ
jgi:hypothetical protein